MTLYDGLRRYSEVELMTLYDILNSDQQATYDSFLFTMAGVERLDAEALCQDCPNRRADGGPVLCRCSISPVRVVYQVEPDLIDIII